MSRVRTESPRFALPRFHKGALGLFLLTVALTAFISDMPVGELLRIQPGAIFSGGGLWQPITANFVFPGTDIGLLLGTLFAQWFFGSELEGFWGTRRYVTLVLGCGIAGYLVYALLQPVIPGLLPHGGSNAMDAAALTAFAVVFGKRQLNMFGALQMSARTLAAIFLALMIVGPILRGTPWPVVIPWLVASAGAFLVTAQPWRARGDGTTPKRPKSKGKASHLRVVKGEDLLN
ncbi:MAG TPA: rhomboid family intramembrane serine protease [Nannocystaceae bacterium]|nr:rhomboid family intramembrane serine protease [Nannocystaceae bacterium]